MIDYFNCATDFADHADNFFFPDPKWLKTINFFSADSAQFSTKSAVKSSKNSVANIRVIRGIRSGLKCEQHGVLLL